MRESAAAILRNYGESTAHSCKGHFKTADFQRIWSILLLSVNIILSVVTLADFLPSDKLKMLSAVALAASIFLLVADSESKRKDFSLHHKFANDYLALHYELSQAFKLYGDLCSANLLTDFTERLTLLNSAPERPHISRLGRLWAKVALDYAREMERWWQR